MADEEKLKHLRAKYGKHPHQTAHDLEMRGAVSQEFRDREVSRLPFANIATYVGAPYRQNAAEEGYSELDIAIAGVPMDLGVSNRAGARLGPRAVRSVERIGPFEHVLRRTPLSSSRVADVGDVHFTSRFDLESCHRDIERFFGFIVAAGVAPVAVGGDHSITYPILRSVGRKRPVGLVHIDAHCDTSGVFDNSKFHHGGPFRGAVLDGVLDPERTIQIGIRGGAEHLWEFSYESGMRVIHDEEVASMGVEAVVAEARRVVGDGPVYVSFDIDGVDPGFAPGTGTPEVGGLTPREVLAILRGLRGLDIVGGDVVEVAPQYDDTSNTAQVAAQVLFTILCLVDIAREKRKLG